MGLMQELYINKTGKTCNVVDIDTGKTVWGSVAAGMLVATKNAKVGSAHPNWKEISYVQRSTDNKWIAVESNSYDKYGYVDTGIASASGYSSIPFYGSW